MQNLAKRIFSLILFGLLEGMAFLFCAWQMLVISVSYIWLLLFPILFLSPALLWRHDSLACTWRLRAGLALFGILLCARLALDLILPV